MAFLSDKARKSQRGNRANQFSLEEDKLIAAGLEEGKSAPAIVEVLAAEGFTRTVNSVRYRISHLREASEKYDSLEALHSAEAAKNAAAAAPKEETQESEEVGGAEEATPAEAASDTDEEWDDDDEDEDDDWEDDDEDDEDE